MSSSNCCFLTRIQVSQEAGQVVWYSHLFQNFPQFIVIHTVKGFGIVNKVEIDVFLELSSFFDDQRMLAIWSLVPLPFQKPAWTSGSSRFMYCWSLAWRIFLTWRIFLVRVLQILTDSKTKMYYVCLCACASHWLCQIIHNKSYLILTFSSTQPSFSTTRESPGCCPRFYLRSVN